MTVLDVPRLLPAPAESPRAHRAAPGTARARRTRRARRSWTAWLMLLLVLGGASYGAYRLIEQRIAAASQVPLDEVMLTAVPMPVGSPDAAVVGSVEVAPGQSVKAGSSLAVIRLTSPIDGSQQDVVLSAPSASLVVSVDAQPGSVVGAGEAVVTLYDPTAMTFQTQLPIEDVQVLSTGMAATIDGPGLGAPVQAVVDRVIPVMDQSASGSTTMTVVLVPVDPRSVARLVPGIPLTGMLDIGSADGTSVLDAGA